MKSYGFLFWAYTLIWAGLASYLVLLMSRLGRVQRSLDAVERELSRDAGPTQRSSGS